MANKIASDRGLLKAILVIWNNGDYLPYYTSFKSFKVTSHDQLAISIGMSYDSIAKLDDPNHEPMGKKNRRENGVIVMAPWTWLEMLGSNIVTDAMDEYQGKMDEWDKMSHVGLIEAMDKWIHVT